MSARRPDIRLTPTAARDVESILAHTEVAWGAKQAADYQAAITRTFALLRDHPRLGQPRDDLFPGYRSINVGQHVIYYHLPPDEEVEVLRILHQRQEPAGKVEGPRD